MKKTVIIGTLFLLLVVGAKAQTNLTGRVYANPNILAGVLDEAVKKVNIEEAKAEAIAKAEKDKGRQLTDKEKAELDKQTEEAMQMIEAMKEGMVTAISVEFKSETEVVSRTKMKIDEEVLKKAGISWLKRKALKAAIAMAPESEKGTYIVKDNLIIIDPDDEPDTLRLSSDGRQIYGKMDDKTNFTLTLTQ
ncbi:MAG: hypothetical protein IJR56_09305 [Bacteroidaceae bacterium]|nr:hypothetical protein [Bacteroidaceae bacterium]MBQ9883649.1 hypothetical protein [Bacteroidaceae bacterium]